MNDIVKKIQHTLIIPGLYANERLDQVLAKLLTEYSRMQIKSWIESGCLLVNGLQVKPKIKVKGGEAITLEVTIQPQRRYQPEAIHLSIVYEDESFLIINKPAGLVVHPGAGHANHTLLNALLYHSPQLSLLPRAGILHRLDKDTSGLLLIAKTSQALKNLSQQLKKRAITREYQAIVYGLLISGGEINAPMGRHPQKRKRMSVIETGKEAITHYRVVEKYRAHTRIKLRLETGRTHQIRVHLSHIHHPLVGDATYGGRVQLTKGMTHELINTLRTFKRQALHAFRLAFLHPQTNALVAFECPLPDDMLLLISALRNDLPSI